MANCKTKQLAFVICCGIIFCDIKDHFFTSFKYLFQEHQCENEREKKFEIVLARHVL